MMAAAESAVKARNFAQAEDLYSACLPIMEQVYAGDSKAMADCLTALGDVFYWQDKFGMALPIYQRLLSMRERMKESSPASIATAYFKVAKSQEHLSNIDEARDSYKRASEIAQKTLMLGHPLLSSVLEAYANFLQEKTTNQGLADDIRRKAKTSKETYVDPELLKSELMEGKVGDIKWKEMPVSKSKDRSIWKTADEPESNHPLVRALRNLRKHPRMTVAFLTLPISLGLLIATISATYYLSGGEQVQVPLVRVGDSFRSGDAQQTLEVLPNNKLSVKTLDDETKVDYITLSNPWRELQYFCFEPHTRDVILYKNSETLTDTYGRVLASTTEPRLSTILEMERFARELHKVNSATKGEFRKAKLREFCARYTYENPYTHKTEAPNVVFGTFVDAANSRQFVEFFHGLSTFDLNFISFRGRLKFLELKPVTTKSLIKCIVIPDNRDQLQASFFVSATDDRGFFLTEPKQDSPLVMNSTNGSEPEHSIKSDESTKISPTSRVVLSKVRGESITTAVNLLAWIFTLLPIFAIGYKVFEPRFNRSSYENNAASIEVYLSYIYILALAAYICFFTGAVFYVLNL